MHPDLRVALIDPVGCKAGMDHYDLLLLQGLQQAGAEVKLYSNFEHRGNVELRRTFHNTGVAKWKAVLSNVLGTLQAYIDCKKSNYRWIILHVFRAGLFDLVMFSIARVMGLKICAIVHDLESLDTFSLGFVRHTVIHRLPHQRVVHNSFCRDQLLRGRTSGIPVHVIPHVNFRHVFKCYSDHPDNLQRLLENKDVTRDLPPAIAEARQEGIPLLLFFGQIKKAKGLDVLLEAIAGIDKPFKLIIAGKVRDESWQKYDDKITALNIRNTVIPVIRHISDPERDYLFAVSKAVVLPYTHIYQSGVLLMAMSFPVTVLASDLPPNAELVEHGRNGLLFKSDDRGDLQSKLAEILEGRFDFSAMNARALEDVDKRYSPEMIGGMYATMFRGNT